MTWVDRSGNAIGAIGKPGTLSPFMDLSPDGSRVVVEVFEDDQRDLWIHDTERKTKMRLTFEGGARPSWSRDGETIFFTCQDSICVKNADGSGEPRIVTEGFLPQVSPDGKWLLFASSGNLRRLDLEKPEDAATIVLEGVFFGSLSPDGRYMLYVGNETGTNQVYLARFPDMTGKRQVSVEGGRWPQWRSDGLEIFYIGAEPTDIMAVTVETEPRLILGNPERLFRRLRTGIPTAFNQPEGFAASRDGQRFVIVQPLEGEGETETRPSPITVVTNWFEEFRQDSS
jgi:dipeptidyl aminopeptidase/acylaminoacyl peptidase